MKENLVNKIESMIIYDAFNNNYKSQKEKMKKNYKAFLMASMIILSFPLASHSSPMSESRTEFFSKRQHSIRSVVCPFEKAVLNYKVGIGRLSQKQSKNIGKESDSSDEKEYLQNHLNALKHFRIAAQNFENQFLSEGRIDPDKFQAIYAGNLGHTLFYYGHALKYIELLSQEKEERIICLNKLYDLIVELSYKEMHLKAPSFEKGQNEGCNMFSSLGYGNQDEAQKFSTSIDQMFLEDPNLMLFTIDLQMKWLTKSGDAFEDFFRDLLAEWEPKFKKSTSQKFDKIG